MMIMSQELLVYWSLTLQLRYNEYAYITWQSNVVVLSIGCNSIVF